MIIYLTGASCVGKTTIGCYSLNGFREKASVVLDKILSNEGNIVVAGTPAGLKHSFLQVYKKHKKTKEIVSIHIKDTPENILERLTFFDKDSNPIHENLDGSKRKRYLREITADYNYFKDSYERADLQIDINDISLMNIQSLIINRLKELNDLQWKLRK